VSRLRSTEERVTKHVLEGLVEGGNIVLGADLHGVLGANGAIDARRVRVARRADVHEGALRLCKSSTHCYASHYSEVNCLICLSVSSSLPTAGPRPGDLGRQRQKKPMWLRLGPGSS